MKKIIAVTLLLTLVLTICSCGNMSMGFGNFTFTKVHVDTYHYSGCLDIEKWYDSDTGIEVKTKDGIALYLSEGTYTLVSKNCPFCK